MYASMLNRHVIKVQSVVRMHLSRQRYIAKRIALGLQLTKAAKLRIQKGPRPKAIKVEERLTPLNPLHMIKGVRKLLKARRAKIENDSVKKIQVSLYLSFSLFFFYFAFVFISLFLALYIYTFRITHLNFFTV